ncbi:MAG: hypothetical protein WAU32_03315 [Thermoanaerobaculia bacterium]
MTREPRLAAAGFLWLALFALLYSAGASLELWPVTPEDAFRDTDLWAGLALGVLLVAVLVAGEPASRGPGAVRNAVQGWR